MNLLLYIYDAYISNILDILTLTVIFYKIILIIKGTRTIQVLAGIFFILALTIVSRDILRLNALSWILENFWLAAVVIFSVVFQTEIRNLFAQVGGQFLSSKNKIKDTFLCEIVESLEDLSINKYGALIVIENEIGLKNFVETGVILGATISKELLLSIFKSKHAPLHDGAVIISGEKIVAANCVIPLSNNANIKLHGTRHRAALGLSESTDAVVIVVSEETGRISVAFKGELKVATIENLPEIVKNYTYKKNV
ncbi:MAG: diadenylate cyclase CdaA [Elusimicrobiota bacterium]|jgi:diadenylate cyclase|nr:diadenylate cyclase CdaA [Elusimicrobiota bacterium]